MTRLDYYICKGSGIEEECDLTADQYFDELSSFWEWFSREEKIEILSELLKLYQSE